jgi:hypothetical protein
MAGALHPENRLVGKRSEAMGNQKSTPVISRSSTPGLEMSTFTSPLPEQRPTGPLPPAYPQGTPESRVRERVTAQANFPSRTGSHREQTTGGLNPNRVRTPQASLAGSSPRPTALDAPGTEQHSDGKGKEVHIPGQLDFRLRTNARVRAAFEAHELELKTQAVKPAHAHSLPDIQAENPAPRQPKSLTPAQRLAGAFMLAAESTGDVIEPHEERTLIRHAEAMQRAKEHFESVPLDFLKGMAANNFRSSVRLLEAEDLSDKQVEGVRRMLAVRNPEHGVLMPPDSGEPTGIPTNLATSDISKSFACEDGTIRVLMALLESEEALRKIDHPDAKEQSLYEVVGHKTVDHAWGQTSKPGESTIVFDFLKFKLLFKSYAEYAKDRTATEVVHKATVEDLPALRQEIQEERDRLAPRIPAFWAKVADLRENRETFYGEPVVEPFKASFEEKAVQNLTQLGSPRTVRRMMALGDRLDNAAYLELHPELQTVLNHQVELLLAEQQELIESSDTHDENAAVPVPTLDPTPLTFARQRHGSIPAVALARRLNPELTLQEAQKEAQELLKAALALNEPHDWEDGK